MNNNTKWWVVDKSGQKVNKKPISETEAKSMKSQLTESAKAKGESDQYTLKQHLEG